MIFCIRCNSGIHVISNQNIDYQCRKCGIISGPRSADNEKIAYLKIYYKIKSDKKMTEEDFIKFHLTQQQKLLAEKKDHESEFDSKNILPASSIIFLSIPEPCIIVSQLVSSKFLI